MRYLLATGGSLHSEMALRYAAHIAPVAQGTATVLIVSGTSLRREQAEQIGRRASEILMPVFPDLRILTRTGVPSVEIGREAAQGGYDLVILGSRPRHRLLTRLRGSVTSQVANHIPCSLLVARQDAGPPQRLLICASSATHPSLLDALFSSGMDALLASAQESTYLHIMSQISAGPGVRGEQLRESAEELIRDGTEEGRFLAAGVEQLRSHNIHAAPKVRHGLVVDEIVAEASEGEYDLVVIGAHRKYGWERYLLGDLARRIIDQCTRSVLLVR